MWLERQEELKKRAEKALEEQLFLAGKYGIMTYIDENFNTHFICIPSNYKLLLL